MIPDNKLIENYEKSRNELEWRLTNLIKNSPKIKTKRKLMVFSLMVLSIALILLLVSIILLASKQPIYNIKNTYPIKVVNPTEIITKEIHLEPDYVEECIKLREINKNVYQIRCKKK